MKIYKCDICLKEVVCLFDLCTNEGIKSVCGACYYGSKLDDLCMATLSECADCEKC